jgi:hypothetical protein
VLLVFALPGLASFTGVRRRALARLLTIHLTDSVPDARRHASRVVRIHPSCR